MADNKKFLDENGLLYYHGKNKEALAKKVDKEDGKGLSTNDFTTAEKTKLAAVAENANNYVLPAATAETLGGIKVGDRLSITADGVLSATVQETVVDTALSDTSTNPVQNKVVKSELDKKVTKVSGKDLSSNDYTSTEKEKLKNIAENAQVNVIETIAVNGSNITVSNKKVDISVPTNNNQLTNGAGYITADAITGKEDLSNKVTTLSSSSTDTEYPSAKLVYTELDKKVSKVSGKGLSTNDYTTTEKNKLKNIAEGAEVNAISVISVNGTDQAITDKKVNIIVPTDNNQIGNSAGYITAAAISDKEDSSNKVTELTDKSTDTQYPSAKLTYTELNKKVEKIEGKGLSTNDFTNTLKTKLDGIAEGAQVNVIESIAVNGEDRTITGKKVDIAVPTDTSELTNNAGFITSAAITGKENSSNKVTSITSSSTDVQYPSAKAVYTGLNGKVDKVSGKGLSTNDYTTIEKNKLTGIAEGAQVNVIESVKVNGTALTPTSKAVNITVPTKLSQLTNDASYAKIANIPTNNNQLTNGAGYQNATQVQSAIDTALSSITGIDFQIVETLPSTGSGKKGVIYLLAHQHGSADTYDEYIWLKGDSAAGTVDRFEKIGSTDIDLSSYWNDTNLTVISNSDIDRILAK